MALTVPVSGRFAVAYNSFMRCEYFKAGLCASCALLAMPYSEQLAAKDRRVRAILAPFFAPGVDWLSPAASPEAGFRNKAKLAVGGTLENPTFGVLDAQFHGVDLAECPLYEPALAAAFAPLRGFVPLAGLQPYRPAEDRGELKHIIVTAAPSGALMVRFVLRSTEAVPRIRKHLPALLAALPGPAARAGGRDCVRSFRSLPQLPRPGLARASSRGPSSRRRPQFSPDPPPFPTQPPDQRKQTGQELAQPPGSRHVQAQAPCRDGSASGTAHVVSVSLLPQRAALTEGEEEIVLTERAHLEMNLGEATLLLRPGAFFQTNTAIARALYAQVREWAEELTGAGTAPERRHSTGEDAAGTFAPASPDNAAPQNASPKVPARPLRIWDLFCGAGGFALHLDGPGRQVLGVEIAEEAVESARAAASAIGSSARFVMGDAEASAYAHGRPDFLVVNPPRRGIGELAGWIEASGTRHVAYSSCNPETLAADLAAMPSYRVVAGRVFDMFPHTEHVETLVLMSRA